MLVLGKHLNTAKALNRTLTHVFGVNTNTATKLCGMLGVNPNVRLSQLSVQHYDKLSKICSEQIGTHKSRQIVSNIKALINVKHYKGVRHMFGLPCRGQRTRTNAATAKRLMARTLGSNKSRNKPLDHKKHNAKPNIKKTRGK
jgi:small subunit ribosomal protein S13